MNSKYTDLFHELIQAYYDGNFDETLSRIMVCHESSPQETFKIITSLCGVNIEFDNNYIYNLKKAITMYSVNKRIVEKLECSGVNCIKSKDDKFTCEAACPFNAIKYDTTNKTTYISKDICINCGICVDSCNGGRILDKVEFIPVMNLIKENKTVIAAVAPAINGQFGDNVTMDMLREAFIKIGFSDMIEVAFAADILSIKEACEFDKHVNKDGDLMITSCCCPMWVGMLKKVYTSLVKDLSPSISPMIAAGRIIKKINPDAKVVFIGPCIAKKAEAKENDLKDVIDFVLTFAELDEIFKALKIDLSSLKGIPSKDYTSRGGRMYARSGGVSNAVSDIIEELYPDKFKSFKSSTASGVKECKEILEKALNKELDSNFIEGMGCKGGCVGGPKTLIPLEKGKQQVDNFAFDSPIKVPLHSETLDNILKEIGINSIDDFKDKQKMSLFERDFNSNNVKK
ncbi:[Fe-Fe] hydrogenase large subunit C-terminal domain-containing protein [Clostridium butyricum]|uniref:[Fe-Fe] hydrogenase large subunit C-terminal domain-containing protein n=1 Tax=Clostridium butyricum TaxID=1492 RepID=UPI0018AC3089|nr:[Fe-Fe] hydrogenase large subunit C-terminal domain-containing protein [Clostridium butyricum]MDB2154534.1 [Fe-Fe] hydrogenase large subunit C-terminal domain-containing protein [Clostridium butyricum]